MRLADFIRQSSDQIVAHSVEFARSLRPLANEMIDVAVLRDHLPLVLEVIALDLEQPQSRAASTAKSEGRNVSSTGETAAQTHGRLRAGTGLTIAQVVAEYRVLRAVVLRLWADAEPLNADAIQDLIRFNEAIDQAIAESVTFHSMEVDRWRDLMLAVISHDLRGPMQALVATTDVLAYKATSMYAPYIDAITRSVHRLTALLDSLLDYSNVRLGSGLRINQEAVDLAAACESEVALLRSAQPEVTIEFSASGSSIGHFDVGRICEAVANLVSNAVQYREGNTAIKVTIEGSVDTVVLTVANKGPAIAPEVLQTLFEPLRRRDDSTTGPRRNLGIGLFVVREIAKAHGGDVQAKAADGKVSFSMRLPKQVVA